MACRGDGVPLWDEPMKMTPESPVLECYTGLSVRCCLVPSYYSGWWLLFGGCEAMRLGYFMKGWPSGYLCYRIFTWSRLFLHGMLILCQIHECIPGRATVLSGNGTGSSTWVHAVRCVWAPTTTSRRARCLRPPLPEAPTLVVLIHCWKPLGVLDRRPGPWPGLSRKVGWADLWWNPVYTCLS
jgi:hypothetical protein